MSVRVWEEQVQLQRETAAASLNRIQKHNQDKCADLHSKIQEQGDKLKEVCYRYLYKH